MLHYAGPIAYAIFLWWFSTGIILFLDGLPKRTFRWSMLGATALLVMSLRYLATGSHDVTVGGAYAAFTFGLLAWGWQEISFYMGSVTGIRTEPCPEDCSGWRHFGHAIRVSLFHELSIIATGAVLYVLVWPGANHLGLWTYVVLWWMHQSAKLNVFLGVRNLNEEFLPDHMAFLKSFLTKKPMNRLFPVSVTISTIVAFELFRTALSPAETDFARCSYLFLGSLMTLAILEHWFLVVPLPAQILWNWSLKSRRPPGKIHVDIVAGFLGAGKTTYIRRLLASADRSTRTIVLVNDFGELGIDGSLLSGRGAEVIELPNGCICCSLKQDLARQLLDVIGRWAPQRVVIEPSGIADVADLLAVVNRPDLRQHIKNLQICTIIDASNFLRDYARMHDFIEAQATLATRLIINKIDITAPRELSIVETSLRALNPNATVLLARHGLAKVAGFEDCPSGAWHFADDHTIGHQAAAAGNDHALDFMSWSTRLSASCHPDSLQDILNAVVRGTYGQVERVKGIARVGAGWVHFDVSGGMSTVAAFAPSQDEEQRVTAIGRMLDVRRLQAAFEACTAKGEIPCRTL
jgi:putative photosynthetic complex assembly protein 2